MKSKLIKLSTGLVLAVGSFAAYASAACCGDLACCLQQLVCCLQ